MKLIVAMVSEERYIESLLAALAEVGVIDAVLLQGEGPERALTHEIPIFAPLSQLLSSTRAERRLILALAEDDDALEQLRKILPDYDIDIEKDGGAVIFSVPVDSTITFEEPEI